MALLSELDVLIPKPGLVADTPEMRRLVDAVGDGSSMRDLVAKLDLPADRIFDLMEPAIGTLFERGAPLPLDAGRAAQLDRFHLEAITSALGPAICDDVAKEKLHALFQAVPIDVRNGYTILEVPLTGEARAVDFACSVLAGYVGHTRLGADGHNGLPHRLLQDPAWAAAAAFGRAWGDEVSVEEMTDIFMEFDLSKTPKGVARPSLWFRIASALRDGDGFKRPAESISSLDDVGGRIFASLNMKPTWDRAAARLAECTRLLPCNGRVHVDSIGALVAREDNIEDLRIFCACIDPEDVVPYLQAIGWSGNLEPVQARLKDPVQPLQINLQLTIRGDTLVPELSLELQPSSFGDSFSGGAMVWKQRASQLIAELERFVRCGWCTPERFDAIESWTGSSHSTEVLGQRVVRLPNHFKLRMWPDGSCLDKMYLGVDFLPPIRSIEV